MIKNIIEDLECFSNNIEKIFQEFINDYYYESVNKKRKISEKEIINIKYKIIIKEIITYKNNRLEWKSWYYSIGFWWFYISIIQIQNW